MNKMNSVIIEHFFKFAFVLFISYVLAILSITPIEETQIPSSSESALSLIFFFIIATLVIIIAIRYLKLVFILNIFEYFMLFLSLYVILSIFTSYDFLLITIPAAFIVLRIIGILDAQISAILTSIGGSLIIGSIIPLFPLMLFSTFLIIYDIFAVFISGHMIELATAAKKQDVGMLIETKKEIKKGRKTLISQLTMGSGDFVLPSSIAISSIPFNIGIYMLIGALIGYWIVMAALYILKRPLPALPFILLPQLLLFIFLVKV